MHTDDLICTLSKACPCSQAKRNAVIWTGVFLLFAAYAGIVWVTLGFRPDLNHMFDNSAMLFKYAFLAAVTVGSGIAWWYSGHPGRTYRFSFYGLIFLGVFLLCDAVYEVVIERGAVVDAVFDHTAFVCIGMIALFGSLGSLALCFLTHCMAPINGRVHAFMTALFASSIGALAYGLHCPHDAPAYLLMWYAGTALAYAALILPVLKKKQSW
jgi:hypothetical protein